MENLKTCVYDNPITWQRECWQDGRLLYAYSARLLSPYSDKPIPREYFFFGANIGDWETGQLVGDKEAMNDKQEIVDFVIDDFPEQEALASVVLGDHDVDMSTIPRKNKYRNRACLCGSGKKVKHCCWHKMGRANG